MRELNVDVLLQIAGGSDNANPYKVEYVLYVNSLSSFRVVQNYVHKLENNEITIDEFMEQVYSYTSYSDYGSSYGFTGHVIEIHVSSPS